VTVVALRVFVLFCDVIVIIFVEIEDRKRHVVELRCSLDDRLSFLFAIVGQEPT